MGVCYYLYEHKAKAYLFLSKRSPCGFQVTSECIAAFLSKYCEPGSSFEIAWDGGEIGDLPHEKDRTCTEFGTVKCGEQFKCERSE